MIPNPNQIHYACIAQGTTVIAEFNSNDAALGAVAAECLDKTPPFHTTFTHTVRSRTYTFLIDEPLVYFAIFDEKLEASEGLAFLKSVRSAFRGFSGQRKLEKLTSHCFQGEFNPVFRQLLGPAPYHMDGFGSPTQSVILARPKTSGEKAVKKMKNRLLGKIKNNNSDENGGSGIGLSREFPIIMHKNGDLLYAAAEVKANKVWKRHVWVVLSLDLMICAILFGVWLWVCSGLKCMET
ncbi:probable vamp-like protein at1g33475 [Phtheirospermum japonicum]|uniref:Probable vamp-like protein at1g33475 n=1 Tax=Phtheirospermum japonicum TaxID=374723 RepID=A0A830D337_9LAMI|nr:probable vamp-like protein at1g33475 [Phtheirospermum japonicum]